MCAAVLSANALPFVPRAHVRLEIAPQNVPPPPNLAVEDALRLLRDFLSSVSRNAAEGDVQSASLSLLCLGEPPKPTVGAEQNSPVAEVLTKMRAARRARELKKQRASSRGAGTSAGSGGEGKGRSGSSGPRVPEVYSVGSKSASDRDLRQQVMLKVWDQARLRRWWDWHDRQMEDLRELQRIRRRQFLSNLRTHPWMNNGSDAAQKVTQPPSEEEARKLRRMQFLSKLRTAPPPPLEVPVPAAPEDQSPEERQANVRKRRESLSKLRPRSNSKPSPPPPSPTSSSPTSPPLSPASPSSPSPSPSSPTSPSPSPSSPTSPCRAPFNAFSARSPTPPASSHSFSYVTISTPFGPRNADEHR
ncbi:hypothetical protein HK104_004332, partial [Borealophlyctis nickersoniae]